MWSLISSRAERFGGSRKFQSPPKKTFSTLSGVNQTPLLHRGNDAIDPKATSETPNDEWCRGRLLVTHLDFTDDIDIRPIGLEHEEIPHLYCWLENNAGDVEIMSNHHQIRAVVVF
jgi:hypothetical protein